MPLKKKPAPSAPRSSSQPGFPDACVKVAKAAAVSLPEAARLLRKWRTKCPNALQLDGHPSGRNNLKPWLHFKLDGFSSPRHDFLTKHSKELIAGNFYNGVWNFHGDAKVEAIDGFLTLLAAGENPVEFLIPSATFEARTEHQGDQNPKFTLRDVTGVRGFYLYQE